MKIRARLFAAVTAVFSAFSVFLLQTPAHAGGGGGDLDTLAPFNRAGEGADWLAITIVMVILAVVVMVSATLVSKAFNKK
ncbi:hypothetical protein EII31_02405 [Leucobacter sp. OH2974_COT-288]|nr:hypothetical protein EII31_02405 [Leucobacter sp. OH2974_COT-288]